MDGTHATCSSTTSAKRQIRFANFGKAPANTRLTVKCAVYKGDQTADLLVRGDNDSLLYTQPLVLDDAYYTFDIPAGTQRVSLIQKEIGKAKNYHRISFQQAFLYSGDYALIEEPLDGYPLSVNGTSYHVSHSQPAGQTVYYRVTPAGLRTSNTIATVVPVETHTDASEALQQSDTPQKVIIHGELYIIRQGKTYDLMGRQR